MKTLLKIFAGLVVLFIIVVIAAVATLDSMIKAGVERVGPEITGTAVKLESVEVSLLSGQGRLKGLLIGNPPGFQSPQAFKLTDAKVKVDLNSVLSEKLIIEEILIDGPDITYEGTASGSNLGKLQANVASFGGTKQQPAPPQQKQDVTRKKVQINDFILRNAQVHASTSMLQGQTFSAPLPEIHLRNLGQGPEGATVQNVTNQVITAINTATIQTVANSGKILGKGLQDAQEAAKRLGGEAGKTGSKAVEDLTKGLFK